MKLLHLSDLHLGKNVLGLSMIKDQEYALNQALILCKKQNIKHIIISGDVYDRSIPNEEAVSVLNNFLSNVILENKIKVYIIPGNHDSKERLACFNGILEKQGLFIDSSINKDLTMNMHQIIEDGLSINIYSLPYMFPGEIRLLSGDDSIKDFESAVSKVIKNNKLNSDEINILNTHYFVIGNKEPIRSDSETKTSVGAIEQISYRVFDEFDYVALGHLHCPQHIERDTVRYAGSLLKYSVDEIKQNKMFTIVDIKSKNDISIQKIPIIPFRDFVCLEGFVDELTKNSEIKDERIVFFKLLDKTPVLNAATRLKIKYPFYVGLTYINIINDINNNDSSIKKEQGFEQLTLKQQFDNFFHFVLKKDLDQIQDETINQVATAIEKDDK